MAFDGGGFSDQERTEQPSAKRREEARREGRVVTSPDLTGALALLGALGGFTMMGGAFVTRAVALFEERLGTVAGPTLTVDEAVHLFSGAAMAAFRLTVPLIAMPALFAVAALLLQTRFVLATKAFAPQWSRLDPRRGLGKLLGGDSVAELVRSLLKLLILGGVAAGALRAAWPVLLIVGSGGAGRAAATVGGVLSTVWLRVGAMALLLAGLDYVYRWWRHEKSLRVTKDEARRESKETDGNPQLRARVRSAHKRLATRRMMADVARADVVLRNPTHVAVALRYESGRMRAPRVVAKGEELLALRIVEIASRHAVPVVEDPPLARALNAAVPVGGEIPVEMYRLVADVLAYVYSLKGRR